MLDMIVAMDHTLIMAVQNHLVTWWLTPFMYGVSTITSSGALWILLSIVLMSKKSYRVIGLSIFIALVLVFLIGDQGLKPHVARLRPFVDFPDIVLHAKPPAATSYSFPSGHSFGSFASATAFYLGLLVQFPHKIKWGKIALIFAALVAFSRVYLFVHYPSDVLTGLVLGLLCGYIAWCIALHISRMNVCRKLFK